MSHKLPRVCREFSLRYTIIHLLQQGPRPRGPNICSHAALTFSTRTSLLITQLWAASVRFRAFILISQLHAASGLAASAWLWQPAPRELIAYRALLKNGARHLSMMYPPPPFVCFLWSLSAWTLLSAVRRPLLMMSTCAEQAKWWEMMFVYSVSALPNGRTRQRLMKERYRLGSRDAERAGT